MEEACSYWSRKVAWRCFLCAAVAAFTIIQARLAVWVAGVSGSTRYQCHGLTSVWGVRFAMSGPRTSRY